jgi:ABC-type sugar transport system ATPase subunit
MSNPILEIKNISKSFPGVQALDKINLDIESGKVHALLGENGAGKSTLVKIISGAHQPDSGTIKMDGKKLKFTTTKVAEQAGVAIIYQELNLIPQMTVAENIFLGREPKTRLGLVDFKKMRADAKKELKQLESDILPNTPVSQLRIGQQQLVEIAKALSLHAKVLIMDEPTSALSDKEVEKLFSVIKQLQKQNVAIIYITHKLEEIFEIAHQVTVLRDGIYIGTKNVDECDANSLIGMMVGRDLGDLFPKEPTTVGDELLRVENITVAHPTQSGRNILSNISFHLNRGEILGIAGLMGSGRTELLLTLFGSPPAKQTDGKIYIKEKEQHFPTPVAAIKNNIALVTEDRKMQGLFLQLSVEMNISIASIKKAVKFWFLRKKLEAALVNNYIKQLRIKVPNIASAVETLSGGNQQKVILAKWMLTQPEILLLDDPTRGIDVGAKAEIYHIMNKFAKQGMGIILVSSELPEVLAMSDRILVLNQGQISAEFLRENATEHNIMKAATLGHAA